MVKRVFSMLLRALQGFLDSVFKLANIPLVSPHDTCIRRRAKEVEVSFETKTRGIIQHLAIDATGLKVYCEGKWKVKKHGTDGKRRVWRKLHIAVDTNTRETVAAELSSQHTYVQGCFSSSGLGLTSVGTDESKYPNSNLPHYLVDLLLIHILFMGFSPTKIYPFV